MSDAHDHHTPSSEFTQSLAGDVARLYRYESRFEPVRRRTTARRVAMTIGSLAAAAVVLAVGLVLGTSTGYASGRVAGEQQRHEIAASTEGVTRQLDVLWFQLVRTRVGLAQLAAAKGTPAHASLAAAEAEVDSMRASVARISRNVNADDNGIPSPPAFALFRANPMRNALTALSCAAALAQPAPATITTPAPPQQSVPVVTLPAASAATAGTIGAVLSVHEARDGKVLVDDGGRRQLTLFDSTLRNGTIVLDSVPGAANYYGRAPSSLTPYLGDSVLFADWATRTMRLLDSHGQFGRSVALPPPADVGFAVYSTGGVDSRGRLIFLSHRGSEPIPSGTPAGTSWSMLGRDPPHPDSLPILRADLELRRVDTIGKIARPLAKVSGASLERNALLTVWAVDPLATIDDWSVLSDGSVAMIRGHDYHIDWVRPSDATVSTPKLPFDWKRLTDADKQRLFDSTRAALHAGMANRTLQSEGLRSLPMDYDPNNPPAPSPGGGARVQGGGGDGGKPCGIGCGIDYSKLVPRPDDVIPLDRIADYYPPLRPGAAIPDVDGNVWVIPTTSAQSQHGELVYDVVNGKGEMVKRVRLPLGRRIVGFGKGGVVYMTSGDIKTGYILERSVLPKR